MCIDFFNSTVSYFLRTICFQRDSSLNGGHLYTNPWTFTITDTMVTPKDQEDTGEEGVCVENMEVVDVRFKLAA